jgi:Bacteriophage T4-like portal protein (Gp20)
MAYKKHFKSSNTDGRFSPLGGGGGGDGPQFGYKNYGSTLPDVYVGHPNRIERYSQYENMDSDPEINAALDIIADFCTQKTEDTKTAFTVDYKEKPTKTENDIITEQLKAWYKLNEMEKRITKMIRNTLKYGDQVFIRDPETFQLYWIDMTKLTKIVVNESEGKEPEIYFIKDLSPNFMNLTATTHTTSDVYLNAPQTGGSTGSYTLPTQPYAGGSRFTNVQNERAIDAKHIMHLSLTSGLDPNWPFGISILENVFKVYKQKELLEDAILIYRVQRAPERRVFYIDTGTMPSHLAMQFVERVKNEIHQRRIPTLAGGGQNIMDATYNPLSINEDYFFPQTAEGRGSKVETLPGGENLGQIDDLRYFNNKLLRGLRIPSSYLPSGPDDGTMAYTDGKVTTALIQENRFNNYCKGLQTLIASTLDKEFKMFLQWRGFNVDNSLFEIKLSDPLNFAAYRSIELDASRIGNFTSLSEVPYLSKRFVLKKYLGLTEIEMKENEEMWKEETGADIATKAEGSDLRNVGITPGDITTDIEGIEGIEDLENVEGEMGADGIPSDAAPGMDPGMGAPAAGGVPAGAGGLPGVAG